MTRSNSTLKIPGQTRDRKRQKNNVNSGIKVRLIIDLEPYALLWENLWILFQITITYLNPQTITIAVNLWAETTNTKKRTFLNTNNYK